MEVVRKRQRDAALIVIERRLSAWAAWAREHRQFLGYPTISALFLVMMEARRRLLEDLIEIHVSASGKETRNYRAVESQYIPEAVNEIDQIVARLPRPLERVITANYFTYGPIEVRAKACGHKRARFSQLLEAAKYSIWVGLDSRTKSESDAHRRDTVPALSGDES